MAISDISSLRRSGSVAADPSWILSSKSVPRTHSLESWDSLSLRAASVPARGTIRGMFMRQACAWIPGPSTARYLPFANYSLREYLPAVLKAAASRYPRERPADALVRLGLDIYPLFASSIVGSTILSVANNAYRHVIELAPKAYPITLSPCAVNVVQCSDTSARIELRDIWVFPEFFHAGIFLGAMSVCGVQGTIGVTVRSPCDVDFALQWSSGFN